MGNGSKQPKGRQTSAGEGSLEPRRGILLPLAIGLRI